MIGNRLAHYEITAKLGSGGMGDVYQAADIKLGRSVAIKFLPQTFAHDSERVTRFQREARVLASLNHPNIAAIYGLEESGERSFLVMELVAGETLAARIARGAVPLEDALGFGIQIAAALESAHEKGISHRDLKPANIKLTNEGTVKVLDFGLAKVTDSGESASFGDSPTLSLAATQAGVILGTAAYMSPEQARGKSTDRRADIWAFGVVLYELLTEQSLFSGEDTSEILAKVIRDEPDFERIPAEIRPLLRRCLEKDPRKRQRDIGDVRIEMENILALRSSSSRVSVTPAQQKTRPTWLPGAIACTVFLVLGAAAGIGLWRIASPASHDLPAVNGVIRLSVTFPPNIRLWGESLAADGSGIILLGIPKQADGTEAKSGQIYTRRFDGYEFKPIPGTEGAVGYQTSPDGQWIVFLATVSDQSSQLQLKKIRANGSAPPVAIIDWEDRWGGPELPRVLKWLEDGDLLILDGTTKIFRLPSGGGPPKPSIPLDTGSMSGLPALGYGLPHDRGVFLEMESWGTKGYQQDTWLLDPGTGKARRLLENASSAAWSPTGHIVFTRGQSLMAVPFDLEKLEVKGEVTPLLDGIRTQAGENGWFYLSSDGRLLYEPGGLLGTDRRLVIVDAAGNPTPFNPERRAFTNNPSISRDGRKAAVILPTPKGTFETWVAELDRPGLQRVLAQPNADCSFPVWSADGRRLAFIRLGRDKDDGLYVQNSDGSGAPQEVLKAESYEDLPRPWSWLPDGSGLLASWSRGGKNRLIFVSVAADGKTGTPHEVRSTVANDGGAGVSPDGKLIAFISDESGKYHVHVAANASGRIVGLPVTVSGENEIPSSQVRWAGDSKRIFYAINTGKLMSVTIETKPALSASTPVLVHDLNKLHVNLNSWDILPDGRLLAIQKGEGEDELKELNIVLNWFSDLRARMTKTTGSGSR
jgi:serine/threonine-protein kinase